LYECVYNRPDHTPDDVTRLAAGYRQRGYRHMMVKPGYEPKVAIERIEATIAGMQPGDIVMADPGGHWNIFTAIQVARAFDRHLPVTLLIEQPCATLEDCVAFREHSDLPVTIDEGVQSLESVMGIYRAHAGEVLELQIPRLGGLTKARRVRELAIHLGFVLTVQERHGSQLAGAACSHFAQSTDPAHLRDTFHFPTLVDIVIADGHPEPEDGYLTASSEPGLGLSVRQDVLGQPVATAGKPQVIHA
jgi:L-alanine-DL-glutamate epimerase-like enolase superfamily enzyme